MTITTVAPVITAFNVLAPVACTLMRNSNIHSLFQRRMYYTGTLNEEKKKMPKSDFLNSYEGKVYPMTLLEELVLLGIDKKTRRPSSSDKFEISLGAAVIMDLYLNGNIDLVEQKKKKKQAFIVTPITKEGIEPITHPVLKKCLTKINSTWFKAHYPIENWIQDFAERPITKEVIADLKTKGVVTKKVDKYLMGLFWRNRFEENASDATVKRLREAVLDDSKKVDCQTSILLTLCQKSDLLKTIFSKEELEKNSERIKEIMSGKLLDKADLALNNLEWDRVILNVMVINNIVIMNSLMSSSHNHH